MIRFQIEDLSTEPCEFRLLRLHLPLPRKGLLGISRTLLHPTAQHRALHAQIPRGLRHRHPAFLNQLHRLQLNSRVNLRRSMIHLRFHSYT